MSHHETGPMGRVAAEPRPRRFVCGTGDVASPLQSGACPHRPLTTTARPRKGRWSPRHDAPAPFHSAPSLDREATADRAARLPPADCGRPSAVVTRARRSARVSEVAERLSDLAAQLRYLGKSSLRLRSGAVALARTAPGRTCRVGRVTTSRALSGDPRAPSESGLVVPPGNTGIPGRPRAIIPTKLLTEKRTTSA